MDLGDWDLQNEEYRMMNEEWRLHAVHKTAQSDKHNSAVRNQLSNSAVSILMYDVLL